MPDSQRYPQTLYLINNMKVIVVFLSLKVLISDICFPALEMHKKITIVDYLF